MAPGKNGNAKSRKGKEQCSNSTTEDDHVNLIGQDRGKPNLSLFEDLPLEIVHLAFTLKMTFFTF